MASLVKFTPISGSHQDYAPASYLLEIDAHKVLLDCGLPLPNGDGQFVMDEGYLKTLKKLAKTVDAVLISHGDLGHCGALPLIIGDLNANAVIFATVPVHHLGLMTLYDTLQDLEPFYAQSSSRPFGYDEVDAAFERIQTLRYSQSITLWGSTIVTPLPAGHALGGSMWRVRKPPAEDILYTSSFNHRREAHLEGALFDAISRPSLMIVNAQQSLAPAIVRKDRDAALFANINGVVRGGGSVMIPVDSAVRMLELALVLETGWNENFGKSAAVRGYILTNQSYRTLEFAKGMLEWMNSAVMKIFDSDRSNPFEFKHLKLVHSVEEVPFSSNAAPMIILASSESLDYGNSHAVLHHFARNSSNCILSALENHHPGSLMNRLLAYSSSKPLEISLKIWKKVPLEGEELARHYAREREEKERKAAELAFAAFEKSRGSAATEDVSVPAIGGSSAAGPEDEDDFAEMLERQIDDANAFRNIFWVDYRSDWIVRKVPEDGDLIHRLLTAPELLSDLYMNLGSSKCRFQSYPNREISRPINEYGEIVSPMEFEVNAAREEPMSTSSAGDQKKPQPSQQAQPAQAPQTQVPFKWESKQSAVVVKCSRKAISGFSGLSDGRSLKTIISRISPRKLVLVGGNSDATGFLLNHYRMSAATVDGAMDAFAPKLHETINVSSSLNLLSGIISEALLNQLRVSYCRDYEISHLQARVKIPEPIDSASDATADRYQTYELMPAPLEIIPPAPNILIGDVKLNEFRRLLSIRFSSSINSEFTSVGDLVCNGKVLIRKDQASGNLTIEGPLCKEFYQIRNILYESVTLV